MRAHRAVPAVCGTTPSPGRQPRPQRQLRKRRRQEAQGLGQLEQFTTDWFAYTDAPLDWYSTEVKGEKVAVPANSYGYEDPSDGNRYGGFRAHTKSPKLARTYFQVRLSENLEANQMYCVSFDISLSDLSKYAVNGIGAYFSDRKET